MCLTDRLSFSCHHSFQLKFMWGNLTLASTEKKDVLVPCLKAGHVGVVSVEFIAPTLEGTYTSHWRLSHKGQQFGPRVWCSIIVDPFPYTESSDNIEKSMISSSKGADLTCQQEVSIGRVTKTKRAHSQLVVLQKSGEASFSPPSNTSCAYIGPSPQGLCLHVLRILVQASLSAFVSLCSDVWLASVLHEGKQSCLACGPAELMPLLLNSHLSCISLVYVS